MQSSEESKKRHALCKGYCRIWELNHRIYWGVKCCRCIGEFSFEKDGVCACCGYEKLVRPSLTGMQVRELALFYSLVNDNASLRLLGFLTKAKTTKKLMQELHSFYYHRVLMQLELFGMVERKHVKVNGQQAISNKLTLKGERFLLFARIYNFKNGSEKHGH